MSKNAYRCPEYKTHLIELLLRLEEAGIDIAFEEDWNVETVGDVYQLYSRHAGRGPSPQPATA